MKRRQYWITIILIWACQFIFGQSFEIPVYFQDAIGNRDTITLGYNILASYGIDSSFGEIDLIDSAYSDDFEVRAAIYFYDFNYGEHYRIIESKKMIIGYICYDPYYFDEANSIMIVVKSDHWPINISWNKDVFLEECNYIDIIDCTPGGWFDVCGGGHPYSLLEMHLKDTATYYDSEFKIPVENDTLRALFFRFYNDFGSAVGDVSSKRKIVLYPNPTHGPVYFDYPLHAGDKIGISDLYGRSIPFIHTNQSINLTEAPEGLYILTIQSGAGGSVSTKIFKNSN